MSSIQKRKREGDEQSKPEDIDQNSPLKSLLNEPKQSKSIVELETMTPTSELQPQQSTAQPESTEIQPKTQAPIFETKPEKTISAFIFSSDKDIHFFYFPDRYSLSSNDQSILETIRDLRITKSSSYIKKIFFGKPKNPNYQLPIFQVELYLPNDAFVLFSEASITEIRSYYFLVPGAKCILHGTGFKKIQNFIALLLSDTMTWTVIPALCKL
jgi:hypothetical protein